MDFTLIIQISILALLLSANDFFIAIGLGFSPRWFSSRLKVASIFAFSDFLCPFIGLALGTLIVFKIN